MWRWSACAVFSPAPLDYIYHHPGPVESASTPPRPGAPPTGPPQRKPPPPGAPDEEHRPGGALGHVTQTGGHSPVPWVTAHAASTAAPRPGALPGARHPKPRPPARPRVSRDDRPLALAANWPTSHPPRARRAPFPSFPPPCTTRSRQPANSPRRANWRPRPPVGPPGGRHPGTGAPGPACGAGLRERSRGARGEATTGVTLPGPPP